jgi:hypothetical protein
MFQQLPTGMKVSLEDIINTVVYSFFVDILAYYIIIEVVLQMFGKFVGHCSLTLGCRNLTAHGYFWDNLLLLRCWEKEKKIKTTLFWLLAFNMTENTLLTIQTSNLQTLTRNWKLNHFPSTIFSIRPKPVSAFIKVIVCCAACFIFSFTRFCDLLLYDIIYAS